MLHSNYHSLHDFLDYDFYHDFTWASYAPNFTHYHENYYYLNTSYVITSYFESNHTVGMFVDPMFDDWFSESAYFNISTLNCSETGGHNCTNYTNMIIGSATHLGCAWVLGDAESFTLY